MKPPSEEMWVFEGQAIFIKDQIGFPTGPESRKVMAIRKYSSTGNFTIIVEATVRSLLQL